MRCAAVAVLALLAAGCAGSGAAGTSAARAAVVLALLRLRRRRPRPAAAGRPGGASEGHRRARPAGRRRLPAGRLDGCRREDGTDRRRPGRRRPLDHAGHDGERLHRLRAGAAGHRLRARLRRTAAGGELHRPRRQLEHRPARGARRARRPGVRPAAALPAPALPEPQRRRHRVRAGRPPLCGVRRRRQRGRPERDVPGHLHPARQDRAPRPLRRRPAGGGAGRPEPVALFLRHGHGRPLDRRRRPGPVGGDRSHPGGHGAGGQPGLEHLGGGATATRRSPPAAGG